MIPAIPEELVGLVKACEGFSAKPYLCPAGFWTIGYGVLCAKDTPPITRKQGEEQLYALLPKYAAQAYKLSPGLLGASVGRRTAIIDFVFNCGVARYASSTLRRKVNAGDWVAASVEIQKWVWGGGKKLPGLVKRRAIESALLLTC